MLSMGYFERQVSDETKGVPVKCLQGWDGVLNLQGLLKDVALLLM